MTDWSGMLKKLEERFGSREGMLMHLLLDLSMSGQPCDITFPDREPMLDVVVDQQLYLAIAYGAGAKKMLDKMRNIRLSNGQVISIEKIWTVNPMPKGGFGPHELKAVDMTLAEEPSGPDGETLRQMIRETYRCKSQEDEDRFIRRFLAS